MSTVEIELLGAKQLQEALKKYPKISEPIFQKAIVATQFLLTKHNLANDPTPYRTGNLLQTFRYKIGRLEGAYVPSARYAIFVHEGTRPHMILPTNRRALYWPGAQHPVRSVRHPGTKANRFMDAIKDKATADIQKLFTQALDMINVEIAKEVTLGTT